MEKPRKYLLIAEACGVLFVILSSFFMSKLYELCSGELLGVMFGSVNQSIWETCKTLLLPYLFWGLIELLSLSPHMRRFTSAKTISLYFLGFIYIGLNLIPGIEHYKAVTAIISVCASFILSYVLYYSKLNLNAFFPPSVFLLFLFWAVYFSFTPFPPENRIFLDAQTGLYGIIPPGFDRGAAVLDAVNLIS